MARFAESTWRVSLNSTSPISRKGFEGLSISRKLALFVALTAGTLGLGSDSFREFMHGITGILSESAKAIPIVQEKVAQTIDPPQTTTHQNGK